MRKAFIFLLVVLTGMLNAQVADRPSPPRLYNNLSREFPDFLNGQEAALMEEKLEQFSNQTSNQICIVIVDDLNGLEASEYAFKIGNQWGVGKADKDNGIVILIKPTQSNGGRDLFIATGAGLEGAIPDIATKKIREQEITPLLKSGQYYEALDRGTDVLMQLAKGEINVKDYTRYQPAGRKGTIPGAIITLIIVIIVARSFFRGGGGGSTFSRAGRAIFWGSMLGGGRGGFGGGGHSSGGGWGGFGGGSFGGGGSGGKW